jgi:hypothetical protein
MLSSLLPSMSGIMAQATMARKNIVHLVYVMFWIAFSPKPKKVIIKAQILLLIFRSKPLKI